MSQKYCLKWNKFQENLYSSLGGLREAREFSDVTLASEDGQQVEAHKVILAASSPFFQNILRANPHRHPLIYMRGMKAEDLVGIVDFLYFGEVNIVQDNLDNFLALAEEMQLKGLTKDNEEVSEPEPIAEPVLKGPEPILTKLVKKEQIETTKKVREEEIAEIDKSIAEISTELESINPNGMHNGVFTYAGLSELDEQVKSVILKSENRDSNGKNYRVCKVCGKEGYYGNVKDHVETNHIEGITIPCELCGKTSKTRDGFRRHKVTHSKREQEQQQQQLSLELN